MQEDNQSLEGEFIPTRESLLSRLKDWGDEEGWKVFFDTYWRLIYSAARKAGLADPEAQDVVQETVICVMKSMLTFKYDSEKGSFKGWLLTLTKWRILDHLRRTSSSPLADSFEYEGHLMVSEIENIADPASLELEKMWNREWEENLVSAAVERVKKKVDLKHYQAFDLYVFKNWPVSKVARTLGISAGRVYLIKHRINNLIKAEIERLKEKPF